MAPNNVTVMMRARRAYEVGRLCVAARVAWLIAPMMLVSLAACQAHGLSLADAAMLFVACIGLRFRGGVPARAVTPGLAAGLAPLMLPLLLREAGHPCTADLCWTANVPLCWFGGVIAGVVVALRAPAVNAGRAVFLASGLLVAGLAGALGCVLGGLAGLLGMAVGMAVGSLPVLAWTQLLA